jgi:hypothetical protein
MLKTDDTHHTYMHTHKMRQIINKTISGCYPQWIGLETMSQKLCMYNIIICTIIYNYVYTYIYIYCILIPLKDVLCHMFPQPNLGQQWYCVCDDA